MNSLTKRREPFTYMLYLGILGSGILFLFIFLVFLKKEYSNQDIPVATPKIFWLSTATILLSSLGLFLSKSYVKAEKFSLYRLALVISFILGILFITFQIIGWQQLYQKNITIQNHTGASFLFILSALHIAHTLGGLIALAMTVFKAFKHASYVDSFVYNVNPPNQLRLKLVSIYWHFLDIMWLIIFLFMLYHAS
jgi:cytochrome c oxidase subunit III